MLAKTPVADGNLIFGSVLPLFNGLPRFLCEQYEKHGPVFRVRALNRKFVVLAGIDAVTFVGSREGKANLESGPSWIGMIGEYGSDKALVAADGDAHTAFREMMQRGYSRRSLDGRYDRIVHVIDSWIDANLQPGALLDAVPRLQELIIDEISIAIADQILFHGIDHIRTQIHWSTNVHLLKRWPAAMLKLPKYRRAKACLMADADRITRLFLDRSGRAEAQGSGARLFDDLIAAHKQRPDLMTDYELPLNLYGPFLAGMDTASNTVAAVLYNVLADSNTLDTVRGEVDRLFDANDSINGDIVAGHAPYLEATVKETMRLCPSVPALMRHATRDFTFADHLVRSGEQVMIATCVPQMSPEYFEHPFEFKPQRFLRDQTHLPSGAYSPYGRGHHLCIGKRIAEVLIPLTVARLLYRKNFRFEDPGFALKGRYTYGVDLALSMNIRAGSTRHQRRATPVVDAPLPRQSDI
ncbi:MAG: cytochrome P450 [Mycolicibacterium neoaurum]|uniref:cytochrome P450 n=1 Tax=Mycolicibacterium neoaurum TaxID=1795 RepID=UPI002FFC2B40